MPTTRVVCRADTALPPPTPQRIRRSPDLGPAPLQARAGRGATTWRDPDLQSTPIGTPRQHRCTAKRAPLAPPTPDMGEARLRRMRAASSRHFSDLSRIRFSKGFRIASATSRRPRQHARARTLIHKANAQYATTMKGKRRSAGRGIAQPTAPPEPASHSPRSAPRNRDEPPPRVWARRPWPGGKPGVSGRRGEQKGEETRRPPKRGEGGVWRPSGLA